MVHRPSPRDLTFMRKNVFRWKSQEKVTVPYKILILIQEAFDVKKEEK